MPTREQLLPLVTSGASYEEIGHRFGIPPGQAYLIVTGLPADGSDVLPPEALNGRVGLLPGGSQHLANPPTEVPTEDESVRDWIRSRARADDQMRRAAAARTAEPPPYADDSTDDVVNVLGRQHAQVQYLQEQIQAIPRDTERHKQQIISILDMMRIRLSQHESAEEAYFWPAVRQHVPDGNALADKALEQEQHGKDLLQELDGMSGDDDRFPDLLEELDSALRKHVAFEDYVFLKAKQSIPEDEQRELGRHVEQAAAHGPTRPHPHAPPGSKAAAAAAAPLDQARDKAGNRPARRLGKAEGEEPSGEEGDV